MKTYTVIYMSNAGDWHTSQFKANGYLEENSGAITLYNKSVIEDRIKIASFPRDFCAAIWENECLIPSK